MDTKKIKKGIGINYHRDKDYQKFEGLFKNIFLKRANLINKFTKHPGRVLEIGCSIGVFLDLFRENGWEVCGVEPSQESRKILGYKDIRILGGEIEETELPKNFFDLVILNHTLEHLDDPSAVLKKVNKTLKNKGIIYVDVPNFGSLSSKLLGKRWPYLLPDEHENQFTRENLTKLLEESGFEILHWESRSGILEYANPLKELGRKRFLIDILTSPYCLIASALRMGDSMSFIARKA